jgi:hypothetical protein
MRVPCQKQISSGFTPEKQCFSPAIPKPTRKSKLCLIWRGFGRRPRYPTERRLVIMTADLRPEPHDETHELTNRAKRGLS